MQIEDYFDFLSPDDIRIKGHRIGIDNVLDLYLDGHTAEEIAQYYPSLSLEMYLLWVASEAEEWIDQEQWLPIS